ncbi:MAG: crossover junction endodeoxyribonuclease RuvC [Elusimicrobiota bacterium]
MNSQRILGIDPGLERTGWAIVENDEHKKPRIIAAGLIETSRTKSLQARLAAIYKEINSLIIKYSPSCAAVEEIFFTKRADTQRNTTYARGVILLALENNGIETGEYNPRTVKSIISGNGNAEKNQIIKSVQLVFGLEKPLMPDDVSDAAAIAFVHLRTSAFKKLVNLERSR